MVKQFSVEEGQSFFFSVWQMPPFKKPMLAKLALEHATRNTRQQFTVGQMPPIKKTKKTKKSSLGRAGPQIGTELRKTGRFSVVPSALLPRTSKILERIHFFVHGRCQDRKLRRGTVSPVLPQAGDAGVEITRQTLARISAERAGPVGPAAEPWSGTKPAATQKKSKKIRATAPPILPRAGRAGAEMTAETLAQLLAENRARRASRKSPAAD